MVVLIGNNLLFDPVNSLQALLPHFAFKQIWVDDAQLRLLELHLKPGSIVLFHGHIVLFHLHHIRSDQFKQVSFLRSVAMEARKISSDPL